MYPVSERYKTAIRARARTDRVTGTLTLTDGTVLALGVQDFMSGSLTLDNQCVTGEELTFGCVYLGQAAFSLRTSLSCGTNCSCPAAAGRPSLWASTRWPRPNAKRCM